MIMLVWLKPPVGGSELESETYRGAGTVHGAYDSTPVFLRTIELPIPNPVLESFAERLIAEKALPLGNK